MSNPKFEVGEIVMAYNSLGVLVCSATMILEVGWVEDRLVFDSTKGVYHKPVGWFYKVDMRSSQYCAEPQLKRIPPPARQTREELRKSLSLEAA